MQAATCTPVGFPVDAQFFGRDTGLLCRGFQALGMGCVVVLPDNIESEVRPDVIHATPTELADIGWWRSRKLDLVVLYAWGDPRYLKVARAIRGAGIQLVQSLDTAGLVTPFGDFREWKASLFGMLAVPLPLATRMRLALRGLRDWFPVLYERRRVAMLEESDAIAAVSEPAVRSVARYVTALGRPDIAERLFVLPHAVVPAMEFDPTRHRKTPKVLVVGRWLSEDRAQKDPERTIAVLDRFLHREPNWTAEVVGRGSTDLHHLTKSWDVSTRARITFTESIPREQLVGRYQESCILLCASRFESFHISSAEALCCGCSIVVADHPLLGSTGWFTTRKSGRLSSGRDVETMSQTLFEEARVWNQEERDPSAISRDWRTILDAKQVAASVTRQLGVNRPPG